MSKPSAAAAAVAAFLIVASFTRAVTARSHAAPSDASTETEREPDSEPDAPQDAPPEPSTEPPPKSVRPRSRAWRRRAGKATAGVPAFGVDMIRPFGKSSIVYNYTRLPVIGCSDGTPVPPREVASDQAFSVSVTPYDCDDRRKRKRRKKPFVGTEPGGPQSADSRPTNTIVPLLSVPVDDGRSSDEQAKFRVPVEESYLLYTVAQTLKQAAIVTSSTDGDADGDDENEKIIHV